MLRELAILKMGKALSFGERKMFDQAYGLVVQEIAVAQKTDEALIRQQIDDLFVVETDEDDEDSEA